MASDEATPSVDVVELDGRRVHRVDAVVLPVGEDAVARALGGEEHLRHEAQPDRRLRPRLDVPQHHAPRRVRLRERVLAGERRVHGRRRRRLEVARHGERVGDGVRDGGEAADRFGRERLEAVGSDFGLA